MDETRLETFPYRDSKLCSPITLKYFCSRTSDRLSIVSVRDFRCQRYAALPSGCKLIQDPNDQCCVKAECAPPTNGQCRDVKDNCFAYGKFACQAPYTAWAKDNCAYYCGFCGEFVGTTVPTTVASVVFFCALLLGLGQLCPLLRLLW